MNNLNKLIIGSCAFLLATLGSASALDLSAYQGLLHTPGSAPRVEKKAEAYVLPVRPEPVRSVPVHRSLADDADASYKNAQLVTLGGNQAVNSREGFTLPPDTRIPDGLRPMFTDRKYPRQGLSLSGLSGSMLIPSPGVLEPGKSGVAVHIIPFALYGIEDQKYDDQNYMDTNVSLAYGAWEGFEIGVDKTFSNQDRFDVPEPAYVNMKYQVPG